MPKYNTMFDVAFTVEHDHEDPEDVPVGVLLDAMQRRLDQLRRSPYGEREAFGTCDTYEIEKADDNDMNGRLRHNTSRSR